MDRKKQLLILKSGRSIIQHTLLNSIRQRQIDFFGCTLWESTVTFLWWLVKWREKSERASKTEVSRQLVYMLGGQSEPDTQHQGSKGQIAMTPNGRQRRPRWHGTITSSYHIICKIYSAPITIYKTMGALHSSFIEVHTTMLKASQNKNVMSCRLKATWDDVLRIDSGTVP